MFTLMLEKMENTYTFRAALGFPSPETSLLTIITSAFPPSVPTQAAETPQLTFLAVNNHLNHFFNFLQHLIPHLRNENESTKIPNPNYLIRIESRKSLKYNQNIPR